MLIQKQHSGQDQEAIQRAQATSTEPTSLDIRSCMDRSLRRNGLCILPCLDSRDEFLLRPTSSSKRKGILLRPQRITTFQLYH